jgi:hypothetical protein
LESVLVCAQSTPRGNVCSGVAMTEAVRQATPRAFPRGPTLVLGPKGRFMFDSAVEYRNSEDEARADREPPSARSAAELAFGSRAIRDVGLFGSARRLRDARGF